MRDERDSWADQTPRLHGFVSREPSMPARMAAAVLARRLDRRIEAGADLKPGTLLAARAARITSRRERSSLSRALKDLLRQDSPIPLASSRIPAHRTSVRDAEPSILAVIARLDGGGHIRPRGAARLRLILGDGAGPLYSRRNDTLSAALTDVLTSL